MVEAPEIPEAKDPFEKRVAITIAILAVAMSLIGNHGDNAKTDAIIQSIQGARATTEASDQWSFYQAKSLKGHAYQLQADLLPLVAEAPGAAEAKRTLITAYRSKAESYEHEKDGIKEQAEACTKRAQQHSQAAEMKSEINDRCDGSVLLIQIAIVLSSVAILSRWRPIWYGGMSLGAIGIGLGVRAFLM